MDSIGSAVGTNIASSQIVAALGVRIEPVDRFGVQARVGLGGLLASTGGLNEVVGELSVAIKPVGPLQIQGGVDVRRTTLLVSSGADRAELIDLSAVVWAGAGVTF